MVKQMKGISVRRTDFIALFMAVLIFISIFVPAVAVGNPIPTGDQYDKVVDEEGNTHVIYSQGGDIYYMNDIGNSTNLSFTRWNTYWNEPVRLTDTQMPAFHPRIEMSEGFIYGVWVQKYPGMDRFKHATSPIEEPEEWCLPTDVAEVPNDLIDYKYYLVVDEFNIMLFWGEDGYMSWTAKYRLSSEQVSEIEKIIDELDEEDKEFVITILDQIMVDDIVDLEKAHDLAKQLYDDIDAYNSDVEVVTEFRPATEEEIFLTNNHDNIMSSGGATYTPVNTDLGEDFTFSSHSSASSGFAKATSGSNVDSGVVGTLTSATIAGLAHATALQYVTFYVDTDEKMEIEITAHIDITEGAKDTGSAFSGTYAVKSFESKLKQNALTSPWEYSNVVSKIVDTVDPIVPAPVSEIWDAIELSKEIVDLISEEELGEIGYEKHVSTIKEEIQSSSHYTVGFGLKSKTSALSSLVILGWADSVTHGFVRSIDITQPANFILHDWSVSPSVINPGESVNILGQVKNVGGQTASDWIDLYVNDMDNYVYDEWVTLGPGESTTVTFEYDDTMETGVYDIKVSPYTYPDEWYGIFEVGAGPAVLELSDWSVSPGVINPGESVTISGQVENTGGQTGSDWVELYVNDMDNYVYDEWVMLGPGKSTAVTFVYSDTIETGIYDILVDLWYYDISWESQFEVVDDDNGEDDDDDDNGNGDAGCPYVSPWNGTGYMRDNNILIASEHQDGFVKDNYVLRNPMVPKEGYYSLKVEEFENAESFFDTFSLYTIDHEEEYKVGTTPEGGFLTYKDPKPPISAYDSQGNDVLEYVSEPDGNSLYMDEGSHMIVNYGETGNARWEHQKLVVRSYGFESVIEGPSNIYSHEDELRQELKTSLHVYLRIDGGEWTYVTVLHPRNHPSDMVVPLEDVLHEFVPGGIGELEVGILSTEKHHIEFIGLDDSVPTPVKVQEAVLVNAVLNGEEDVTDLLLEEDDMMISIVPGDEIILTFEIPDQNPSQIYGVRDYLFFSKGYYQFYEGG